MSGEADTIRDALHALRANDTVQANLRHAAFTALDVLVAENERYRDALEAVEWSGYSYVGLEPCPACGNERVKGHAAGCLVGAALAGGGDA